MACGGVFDETKDMLQKMFGNLQLSHSQPKALVYLK
jgi:hypothetical protein